MDSPVILHGGLFHLFIEHRIAEYTRRQSDQIGSPGQNGHGILPHDLTCSGLDHIIRSEGQQGCDAVRGRAGQLLGQGVGPPLRAAEHPPQGHAFHPSLGQGPGNQSAQAAAT